MTLRLLLHGPRLRWKVISHQMEEVIVIIAPILTTKRELAACRIQELPGVTKAEEAEAGSELETGGSTAQAHDHEAEVPPRSPSGLCFILASSPCLPSRVPARLWELENETPSQPTRVMAWRAGGAFVQRTRCPFLRMGQCLARARGIPAHSTLGRAKG